MHYAKMANKNDITSSKNNNNVTNNKTIMLWLHQQWCILALFVVFCCDASLPVAASTVGNRVDSNTETIAVADGVGLFTVDGISSDGVPKRSAKILQMPHVIRHQEHYSHRIEKAVNDLKRTQLLQQLSGNYSNSTTKITNSSDKKYIHFQSQFQPHMSEHLRHYNGNHYSLAPVNKWKNYLLPPIRHQHHLQRQQHRQQQHDRQDITEAAVSIQGAASPPISRILSTVTEAPLGEHTKIPLTANGSSEMHQHKKPHRFYDRDGLYQRPYLWTTRGPRLNSDQNDWKQVDSEIINLQNRKETNSQRISLNLKAASDDEQFEHKEIFTEASDSNENDFNDNSNVSEEKRSKLAEYGEDNSSDYDDYSYDDDDDDPNGNTMYGGEHRAAVKRFTNPFNELRLPRTKLDNPRPYSATHRRSTKDRGDDERNDSDDNSDADFSTEKWKRIEEEHHRKQQEHQRQMLALRARHDGKYRSTEAAATIAPAIVSSPTTVVKQKQSDDEDVYNINSQNYIPGTLTRQKQEELGTLTAVQQSRRSHVNKHIHEKALAGEHVKQILSEATCRIPQRRVERIQRDPSKLYMPHCTVLHRCTDEAGCCRSERQTCAPKHTKSVDLYFYVRSFNEKRGTVERLTFVNHTECHCVEKTRQEVDEYHTLPMYGISYGGQTLRRATILNCNCPKLYEKILQEDGFCRCDCSSGNTGCDWLKRGMEHFSMIDRKCIADGRCKPPTCEHGNYIKKYGRCPRREEQLSATLTSPLMLATNAISGSDYH